MLVGLVCVWVGGAASGGAADREVLSARDRIDASRAALRTFATQLRVLERDASTLANETAALAAEIRRDEAGERTRRVQLEARLSTAADAVPLATRKLTTRVDVEIEDLSRPLEAVSRAIHASDELATLVVDGHRGLRRVWAGLNDVSSRVRLAAYTAAVLAPAVAAEVRTLAQAEQVLLDADGDDGGIVRLAREARRTGLTMIEGLDAVQAQLRGARSTVLATSVSVQERRATARQEVREMRDVLEGLYDDMYTAEVLVAELMPQWSGLFEGMDAPAIRGDGPLYLCPVDPPRSYSDDFGAPRYTGGYHPHAGNDIFAPAGTPVRAPFDGVAVDASNTIGGYAVKVFGEDGYVYNAHLSAFGTLGTVTAGTVIGYVGNTGNAATTPAHDHFEWHPGNGGPVNPFPYLNEVCAA